MQPESKARHRASWPLPSQRSHRQPPCQPCPRAHVAKVSIKHLEGCVVHRRQPCQLQKVGSLALGVQGGVGSCPLLWA